MQLDAYLRAQLPSVEWKDKHIHYVDGPAVQHYALTLWLPVPLDATDKSPEAALDRFLNEVTTL